MSTLVGPMLVLTTILSLLLLFGFILNHPRMKRWKERAEAEGSAICQDCGHIGSLSYGLLEGKGGSSTNIRLVCQKCNSQNWFVPGGKRDPGREGIDPWRE